MDYYSSLLPCFLCTLYISKEMNFHTFLHYSEIIGYPLSRWNEIKVRSILLPLFSDPLHQQHLSFEQSVFFLKHFLHLNILSIFFSLIFWGQLSSRLAYFTKPFPTKGDCFYLWTAITHTLPSWHLYTTYSDSVLCSLSQLMFELF